MKVLLIAVLCATALAGTTGVRPEEYWRPAVYRDLTKYRPRSLLFSQNWVSSQDPASTERRSTRERIQRKVEKQSVHDEPPAPEECGIEGPSVRSWIVGGEAAQPYQWPWFVVVFIDSAWICTGSLISDTWVLTAAHCVDGASYFDVLAGLYNMSDPNEAHRVEVTSYTGILHQNWDGLSLLDDIALIKLPNPLTFNSYIRPVCLPQRGGDAHEDNQVTVVGLGDGVPVVSMVEDVQVLPVQECELYYGSLGAGASCLDVSDGRGPCNGDSGSPVLREIQPQKWSQVGVVSFGSSLGCEAGLPVGFTEVEYYVDWILNWIE